MRIRNIPKEATHELGKTDKEGRISDAALRPKFAEQLGRAQENVMQQRLDSMLKDLESQGQRLTKGYDIKELVKYKEMVKTFLQEAVHKMYKLREEMGWDRRGRHKVYSMVETVDKELEELTELFMSEQKDNIEILKKLDGIKGLLVDIYS